MVSALGDQLSRSIEYRRSARRLTALTDGTAIQVLTGAPNMTVAAMKEVLVQFVHDELVAPRTW